MDHDEVLEQLELAAVEPDGLERLMAGDTAAAAAVAGHLAGCEACAGELERLRRATPLLRDVVRTTPPDDLRERTLAFVREHGIARGPAAAAATPATATAPTALPVTATRAGRSALPWVAAIAAAVVISVMASTVVLTARMDERLAEQDQTIAGLEAVSVATLTITADPAAQRVALAGTGGNPAVGSLLYSPTTSELVVVATGLEEPPEGQEYRCWVELDGQRQSVGKMYFADELAYWVGDTPVVGTVPDGTTFGVSLVDEDGTGTPSDPVMIGQY